MPKVRLFGLLLKPETVEGTDSLPVPATDGIQLEESVWAQIETDYLEKNERDNVAGSRMGATGNAAPTGGFIKVTAVVATKGQGEAFAAAARPETDVLRRIAGLGATLADESLEYAMDENSLETATMYAYSSGTLFKAVACKARLVRAEFNAGRIVRETYEIIGRMTELPVDAAVPAIVYPRRLVQPPTLGNALLTLDGVSLPYRTVILEPNVDLVARPRGNAPEGHAGYDLADMRPQLRVLIDSPSKAAFDPWALRKSATDFEWSLGWGSEQYNTLELAGPAGQVVGVPAEESDKLAMLNLQIRLKPTDALAAFRIVHT